MAFEQYATGVMTLGVTGQFHCGPNHDSPKQFTWEVLVTYPDGVLDEHGFLLDNLTFEEFFSGLGTTELSCEKLTEQCCEELWKLTGGRAVELRTTVWAIPNKVKITKVRRAGE